MHIDFIKRLVKEPKALLEQRQLPYTQKTSTEKMVGKTVCWVRKYYCDMLKRIILNYILIFSCMGVTAASDENCRSNLIKNKVGFFVCLFFLLQFIRYILFSHHKYTQLCNNLKTSQLRSKSSAL